MRSVTRPIEWHVPANVQPLRIALVAAPDSLSPLVLAEAGAPLRASTRVLPGSTRAVERLVAAFRDVVRDGCDPQQVCLIGAGVHASSGIAAALLLLLHREVMPFATAAVTPTARFVLRLEGVSADELIHHLADVRSGTRDRGLDESMRLAAVELDRMLSATEC